MAALVTAALVTVGMGAAASGPAQAQQQDGNFVANGTFESGINGWHGNPATKLALVDGFHDGLAVALNNIAARPSTVVINDRVDSAATTIPGHRYRASAYIRVPQPDQSVVIRLREWGSEGAQAAPVLLGQEQSHRWVTRTGWQRISVSYIAKEEGGTLDLNLVAYRLNTGARVEVDDITLYDLGAAPATPPGEVPGTPPETQPPQPSETPSPPESPDATTPPVAEGNWSLIWSDEFSGNAIDRNKWTALNSSTYGDGNNELACLMDRPENVSVSDGLLHITAQAEKTPLICGTDARFPTGRSYSSGFLDSRGKASFEYGRFEIRAKTPNQYGQTKGLWPAFWLRPESGGLGELDIFEIIGTSPGEADTSNRTTQSIHYDYLKTHPKQNHAYDLPSGNFGDGFHTHVLEWAPGSLRWYVDGVLSYERDSSTTPWLDEAFSGPFSLRLNMAVGGTWTGSPDAHTLFPATLDVDYVRVYQHPAA